MQQVLWYALGAGALVVVLIGVSWLIAPRGTTRSLLRVGPITRGFRWYRSLWLRAAANIAAWPHLIDRLMGTHRTPVAPSPSEIVWEEGKASLRRMRGPDTGGPPVLVVHSFISKPWILDLTPDRSFLGALVEAGFDTYLLDWGDFDSSEAEQDLSHFAGVLMRAEQKVLEIAGSSHLHLVGYCLGATLCLARTAARRHDNIASLSLVAAPGDFGVPSGLQVLMSNRWLKPVFFLDGSSCVPASAVRESFHWLRPQALKTVRWGATQRHDPEVWRTYGALARWVWEHRRLPGALFFDLVDMFRTNSLYEGQLEVAGELARLSDIRVPIGVFVADRDHIVPSGSSHALATVEGLDVEVFNCASGHVSMICGAGARDMMWPRLIEWVTGKRSPSHHPRL